MRVIITSIPGCGHLCPLIPLAIALRDSGHDVALATSISMLPYLQEIGIELLPVGPDWMESDFSHDQAHCEVPGARRQGLTAFMMGEVIPKTYADLLLHFYRWRPQVIISNDYETAGRAVAELHRIPFVLASSGPRISRRLRDLWHTSFVVKTRRHAGLTASEALDYSLRWLHLCFSPDWYRIADGPVVDRGATEFGIRPRYFDNFQAWSPRSDVNPGQVGAGFHALCTLGTVFNKDLRIVNAMVEGIASQVGKLSVLIRHEQLTQMKSCAPANVEFIEQGCLSSVLKGVDYCISHGGTSTLMTSLLQGIPSLIFPQGADQIANGIACQQLGLGVVLQNATVDARTDDQDKILLTPTVVGQAFQQLVSNGAVKVNCLRFQEACETMPDLDHAVELIGRLVKTSRPVELGAVS